MMSQTIDEIVKPKNVIAYQPNLKEQCTNKEPKIKLWNSLDGSSHSISRKENKRYGDNGNDDMDENNEPQEMKPFVKSPFIASQSTMA